MALQKNCNKPRLPLLASYASDQHQPGESK
jgi:hypothetical protein